MKNIVFILLIIFMMSETTALPVALCSVWKEAKEKLMKKIKSPTISREEANETLWFLFLMDFYEKTNSQEFVHKKPEKTISDVFNHRLQVLGQLARSHGGPCEL